jgi:hypothetical protein
MATRARIEAFFTRETPNSDAGFTVVFLIIGWGCSINPTNHPKIDRDNKAADWYVPISYLVESHGVTISRGGRIERHMFSF